MPTPNFREWLRGTAKIPEVISSIERESARKASARQAQEALRASIEAAPPDMSGTDKRAMRNAIEDAEDEEGQADKALVELRLRLKELRAIESLAAAKPLAAQYRTVANRLAAGLNTCVADSHELIALIESLAALGFRSDADGLPKPPPLLFDLGSLNGPSGKLMPSQAVFNFGRDATRAINRLARLKGFSL
jgi:hypothetical protein